jgi:hypothetical protein
MRADKRREAVSSQKVPTQFRHVPTGVRHDLRQEVIKQRQEAKRKKDEAANPPKADAKTADPAKAQGQIAQSQITQPQQDARIQEAPRKSGAESTATSARQGAAPTIQSTIRESINSFVAPVQDRARALFSSLRETLFGGRNKTVEDQSKGIQTESTQSIQAKNPWGTRTNGLGASVLREASGLSTSSQARPRPLRDAAMFASRFLEAAPAELPSVGLREAAAPVEAAPPRQAVTQSVPKAKSAPIQQEQRSVLREQIAHASDLTPIEDKPQRPQLGDDLPRIGLFLE